MNEDITRLAAADGPDPDACTCGHLGADHVMKQHCVFPCSVCECADFDAAVPFTGDNEPVDDKPATVGNRLDDLEERLDGVAANSLGREGAEGLTELIFRRAYEQANEKLVHRLDALEVRVEEMENAMRDVLVLAPYLRTFSERVTELEQRAGHPYAA